MSNYTLKDIQRVLKQLKNLEKQEDELIQSSTKYEKEVQNNIDKYIENQYKKELRNTPIEELKKYSSGIRYSTLRNAGYNTLSDLKGKKVSALTKIDGIGEKSAEKIVSAYKSLEQDIKDNITVQFNEFNSYSDEVVKSIYKYKEASDASKKAVKIKEYYSKMTESLKNDLKPATNVVSWLFSSKSAKEKAMEAAKKIEEYLIPSKSNDLNSINNKQVEAFNAKHDQYWKDFARNNVTYHSIVNEVQKDKRSKGYRDTTRKADIQNGLPKELAVEIEKVELDLTGLKATLRPYQKFGVQYIMNQGCVLLGDEMGLGKTIQAIASMVVLRNNGSTHFVVVCPASVLTNWQREVQKFSDLHITVIHGATALRSAQSWNVRGGVAITTYETINRIHLASYGKIDMLVVDEAHYVKNPNAQRTQSLLNLRRHTGRVLFMTGTPLENRLNEMVFLIRCLQPEIANKIKSGLSAQEFRYTIAPVYFRRKTEDVLKELPSKIEEEVWCQLGEKESIEYCQHVMNKEFMKMRQVSWDVDIQDSIKASQLKSLCDEAILNNRKVLVFSFFTNTMEQAKKVLGDSCFGPINGSMAPVKRQEIVDEFTNHEGGTVLLSQIQAGGTGLNIQAASIIVFCEPQLKPSLESQAIARAYRMNQQNNVLVYRLLCENTVDERIRLVLKNKQQIFDDFADQSESGKESLQLSELEISNIMNEEYKSIQNRN